MSLVVKGNANIIWLDNSVCHNNVYYDMKSMDILPRQLAYKNCVGWTHSGYDVKEYNEKERCIIIEKDYCNNSECHECENYFNCDGQMCFWSMI